MCRPSHRPARRERILQSLRKFQMIVMSQIECSSILQQYVALRLRGEPLKKWIQRARDWRQFFRFQRPPYSGEHGWHPPLQQGFECRSVVSREFDGAFQHMRHEHARALKFALHRFLLAILHRDGLSLQNLLSFPSERAVWRVNQFVAPLGHRRSEQQHLNMHRAESRGPFEPPQPSRDMLRRGCLSAPIARKNFTFRHVVQNVGHACRNCKWRAADYGLPGSAPRALSEVAPRRVPPLGGRWPVAYEGLPPSLHRCLAITNLMESPQPGVRKRT